MNSWLLLSLSLHSIHAISIGLIPNASLSLTNSSPFSTLNGTIQDMPLRNVGIVEHLCAQWFLEQHLPTLFQCVADKLVLLFEGQPQQPILLSQSTIGTRNYETRYNCCCNGDHRYR